jgi:hypothetical protein
MFPNSNRLIVSARLVLVETVLFLGIEAWKMGLPACLFELLLLKNAKMFYNGFLGSSRARKHEKLLLGLSLASYRHILGPILCTGWKSIGSSNIQYTVDFARTNVESFLKMSVSRLMNTHDELCWAGAGEQVGMCRYGTHIENDLRSTLYADLIFPAQEETPSSTLKKI